MIFDFLNIIQGIEMIKAINEAAEKGYLENVHAACTNCDPRDVCDFCDVRDSCSQCDSEWCMPFVRDWN